MPDFYVDVLRNMAVRSLTSSAQAAAPDIKSAGPRTINVYFVMRSGPGEAYIYQRYANAVLQLNLRQDKAPNYGTFTLNFNGYVTSPIDVNLPAASIVPFLEALPTIGKGNIQVTGDKNAGWTIEWINNHGGVVQPVLVGSIVTSTPSGEIDVNIVQAGGATLDAIQSVRVRCAPLASVATWTEFGVGGGTPGWTGTLDTTGLAESIWEQPDSQIILELLSTPQNARSGTDGVTVSDGRGRTVGDGVIGSSVGVAGATGQPITDTNGNAFIYGANASGVYGRLFTPDDVGRTINDPGNTYIPVGTTITACINQGDVNGVQLSQPFISTPPPSITYTTGALPSFVLSSATAAFTAADIGEKIAAVGIPAGAFIKAFIDATHIELSQRPTATGSSLSVTITGGFTNVIASISASFGPLDVGAIITAPNLPTNTRIISISGPNMASLSENPTSAATLLAWTILPKSGFGVPVITTTVPGTITTPATQRITLSQNPVSGYITLQSGLGSPLPVLQVPVPLNAANIKTAIDSQYIDYGGVTVNEIVPGQQYDVVWGKPGRQTPLIVNDINAIYNRVLMRVVLVEQQQSLMRAPPLPPVPLLVSWLDTVSGIYYFGGPSAGNYQTWQQDIQVSEPKQLADGTMAYEIRRRSRCLARFFSPSPMNTLWSYGLSFYLVSEENFTQKDGILEWDRVYVTLPAFRVEIQQTQRPFIGISRTLQGTVLIDAELYSVSVSKNALVAFWYALGTIGGGTPPVSTNFPQIPISPYGVIIHWNAGVFGSAPIGIAGGGFQMGPPFYQGGNWSGTFGSSYYFNWSRRRWRGNIWEQTAALS